MTRGLLLAGLAVAASGCGSSDGGTTGSLDLEDVMLVDVQAAVFSPRCAIPECHVGMDAPLELDLSSGESAAHLIDVPSEEIPELMRVDPGDPAGSYLYMKLTADPDILGDPMPAEGEPLSNGELRLVEAWIEQGAR